MLWTCLARTDTRVPDCPSTLGASTGYPQPNGVCLRGSSSPGVRVCLLRPMAKQRAVSRFLPLATGSCRQSNSLGPLNLLLPS